MRNSGKQIEYKGKKQNITRWCKELGVPYVRTYGRMHHLGLSFEEAIDPKRRSTGDGKIRKPRGHNKQLSKNQIRVDGRIIEGEFVAHTANGLFRSDEGFFLRDGVGNFKPMTFKGKREPKIFACDITSDRLTFNHGNGIERVIYSKYR